MDACGMSYWEKQELVLLKRLEAGAVLRRSWLQRDHASPAGPACPGRSLRRVVRDPGQDLQQKEHKQECLSFSYHPDFC